MNTSLVPSPPSPRREEDLKYGGNQQPAVFVAMWSVKSYQLVFLLMVVHQLEAFVRLNLEEGRPCETVDGKSGSCKLLSSCRHHPNFHRENICGFEGKVPIICCPNEQGQKVMKYCERLQDSCNGPQITKQVLGGTDAKPRDHTHMALIGFGTKPVIEWLCGGSLITAKYILSAAHCVKNSIKGLASRARLGDLDISTDTDDAEIQERDIVERIVHPQYKETALYNDIALFRMNKEVVFTAWVSPVCLHTRQGFPTDSAIVTGWGTLENAGPSGDHLQEAELDIYNDTQCRRLMNQMTSTTPRGIDSKLMFCAGKSDGSKDSCQGDSGGPLILEGECIKTQIGVVSYGNGCGLPDSPGVYSRVSTYIAWIESIAFDNV